MRSQQLALLERQNHELEAQVARANADLAELGQLLQQRSAEATEAAQRLTEVETELARLKMERALQAGRSPYSPNVSFYGDTSAMPSAVPSDAVSTPGLLASPMRRPPAPTPTAAKPLAEQLQAAQVVITAPSDDAIAVSGGPDHDAVVPNLDTSMLSVSIAQHLSAVSAGRGESAMDMSYDEEWRIADNAYISLNDRIRKLEALRNTLDQRLRKGAAAGPRRRRRLRRGRWALTADAHRRTRSTGAKTEREKSKRLQDALDADQVMADHFAVPSRIGDADEETASCASLTSQRRLEENTAVIAAAHENVARLTAELQALQLQAGKGTQRRPCVGRQNVQANGRLHTGAWAAPPTDKAARESLTKKVKALQVRRAQRGDPAHRTLMTRTSGARNSRRHSGRCSQLALEAEQARLSLTLTTAEARALSLKTELDVHRAEAKALREKHGTCPGTRLRVHRKPRPLTLSLTRWRRLRASSCGSP